MAEAKWKQFLKDAGLVEGTDAYKTAASAFEITAVADALEKGVMRQGDYSRAMDDLRTTKADLQSKWETANDEYIRMQRSFNATDEEKAAALVEAEKAKTALATANASLEEAKRGGDPEKIKEALRKEILEEVQNFNVGARSFELDCIDIQREHKQLFGEELSVKQIALAALDAKQSPNEYWEKKYNVTAKKAEIAKTAHEKELADATERGRQAGIQESVNRTTREPGSSKNAFFVTPGADGKDGLQPWDQKEAPPAEKELLKELTTAHYG